MNESLALIIATLVVMSLIDYIPRAFIRIKRPVRAPRSFGRVPQYFIMPTVYGDISYLQNIPFLKQYASHVVICTSTHETSEFYRDLRAACRKHGFRYICADVPVTKGKPVKNAYTIYKGIFASSKYKQLGGRADTPCLLMDADTYTESNVNHLMRTFVGEGIDIASLRCEAANPEKTIEKLQAFEYSLAMDNRRMDPWLTSGACNIAKLSVFRKVFARHSNFFAGGDIEIGKIAQVSGYLVRYIDFTFYTAVPDTFINWFKQRRIWFAGGIRHHVANIGSYGWHHFFMLFYNSLIIYLLLPLRWIEVVNYPFTMLALIALSWLYTAILLIGKPWHKEYLLLPFYSFVQSMIILPSAFVRYARLAWSQRSFGFLSYDLSRFSVGTRALHATLNVSSATLIIYAALAFTLTRAVYWWDHHGIGFSLLQNL